MVSMLWAARGGLQSRLSVVDHALSPTALWMTSAGSPGEASGRTQAPTTWGATGTSGGAGSPGEASGRPHAPTTWGATGNLRPPAHQVKHPDLPGRGTG